MLIAFAVKNHRSIRDRQVLNMEATSDTHLEESRVIDDKGQRLLRSAAIYGPNASGKSNLVDAMQTMRKIVLSAVSASPNDQTQVNRPLPVEPFRLSSATATAASEFQAEFWLDGYRYRYGFEADKKIIRTEWLKRKGKGKEAELFNREGQEIKVGESFPEGTERKQFLRANSLFLSLCADLAGETSTQIVSWFQKLRFVSGLEDNSILYFTAKRLRDPSHNKTLVEFAKRADLSICGLSSKEGKTQTINFPESMPGDQREQIIREIAIANMEVKTMHARFGPNGEDEGMVEFDLRDDESEGTRKFISLSGPLHHTIEENAVLIIDEFEARMHPLLTQAIVEWFHGPLNKSKAQLIICTHDVLLMEPDHIRRDQVWFTEKNAQGATQLYSLSEFDPNEVRPTTKFSRRYLLGLFGAIPHLALMKGDPVDAETI